MTAAIVADANGHLGSTGNKTEHIPLKDAETIFVEACYGSLLDGRWKVKKSGHDRCAYRTDAISGCKKFLYKVVAKQNNNRLDLNGFLRALEMVSFKLYPGEVEEDRLEIMIIEKIYPLIQDTDNTEGKENIIRSNKKTNHIGQPMQSPCKSIKDFGNTTQSGFKGDGNTPGKNSLVSEKWENSEKYTQDLIAILQDKQMVEVLGCVHKSLYPIYVLYSDSNNFICFKQFMKFMKDFEVFPSIMSHSKLTQLYHELNVLHDSKPDAQTNSGADKENGGPAGGKGVIDQHLFIECLAIVAAQIDYPEYNLSNIQKVTFFWSVVEFNNS